MIATGFICVSLEFPAGSHTGSEDGDDVAENSRRQNYTIFNKIFLKSSEKNKMFLEINLNFL